MTGPLDEIDHRLLDGWQRDLPLVPRPFAAMAGALGIPEAEVRARLARLARMGAVSRVGATCRPNTAGASTLAALAAPDWKVEAVAATLAQTPGVNHVYLREDTWNLWFVATGPDRGHVDHALDAIRRATGLRVLDLPLVRPFNIDLGFPLRGDRCAPPPRAADPDALRPGDRAIMQALSSGLALVSRPFAAIARDLGRGEAEVLERIRALAAAGILSRVGVIVRHRALGWRSNAMVLWQAAPEEIDRAGPRLAAVPGVTLCYERRPVPVIWPYTLYCMIHARSRAEAFETLARAAAESGLEHGARRVLFSTHCYKQTGALVATGRGDAA
ncbi:Lrp/AsnC family transcriptional regulator [Maritimibacter sp. 55A14]|uniref:siroheme decarboxylase subunit beta n=1 Tax=Maritimibacter sp. 55A14 TaxID=2174844 RepID=UPI000D60E5B2|nr:AsnC family transcriptional regulator [Maritimibacter sp. 55A14]PWE34354.1 Lrp/AsnC family transcriptional regulator [Maritimibacter sp. 55A14]